MRERIFLSRGLQPSLYGGTYIDFDRTNYYTTYPYYPDFFVSGMIDVVSSEFRARQRLGEIINNPLWAFTFNLKQTKMRIGCEGRCQYYIKKEPELVIPSGWTFGPPFLNGYAAVVDTICNAHSAESSIAQAKAWANIDVSEIQGLASLGELPETINMLFDLVKEALKLTLAAKRGDFAYVFKSAKKAGATVDGLANLWLGYRYGIRPLITEIRSLMQAVAADLEKGQRFTARGKNKEEGKSTSTDNRITTPSTSMGVVFNETLEWSRSYRSGVLVSIDRSIDQTAAIWGLDSPFEAAWELVPFSFIIDWFTNIGDCLGALVLNPGLSPLSSWVTEIISQSITRKAVSVYDAWTGTDCWDDIAEAHALDPYCQTTAIYTVKRRIPLAERFQSPSLKLNLNLAKLTDLALIARKLL